MRKKPDFSILLESSSRDSCFSVISRDWKIISDHILLLCKNKDSFDKRNSESPSSMKKGYTQNQDSQVKCWSICYMQDSTGSNDPFWLK